MLNRPRSPGFRRKPRPRPRRSTCSSISCWRLRGGRAAGGVAADLFLRSATAGGRALAGPPPETHASHALEWFWTIAPLLHFHGHVRLGGRRLLRRLSRRPTTPPRSTSSASNGCGSSSIPKGSARSTRCTCPSAGPCKLLLTSEDVIHSFFVPAFRIHMDVLPDRYTSVWFQADRPGTYHLFCSQYCGTNHAGMIGAVVVMEPADYRELAATAGRGLAGPAKGGRCFSSTAASVATAPTRTPGRRCWRTCTASRCICTTAASVMADENYIRESILDPGAKIVAGYENIMPTFQGQVERGRDHRADRLHPVAEAGRDAAARGELSAADDDAARSTASRSDDQP